MSDAINNRKENQDYIRQIQQSKSERRKELSKSAQEDLRNLKQHYKNENAKLEEESSAVINHIKADTEASDLEARAEQAEKKQAAQTYNRSGKTENSQQAQQSSRQPAATRKMPNPTTKSNQPQPMTQNYVTRGTDAFYKVQDRGSQISERSDGYEIQAYVPEHEKDNLRVTIQNDKAIISGKRKFKDAVETEDKKISTNNFQTFHEEFKLGRPVSTAGMTREREGDYIKFFIPKLESISFDEET